MRIRIVTEAKKDLAILDENVVPEKSSLISIFHSDRAFVYRVLETSYCFCDGASGFLEVLVMVRLVEVMRASS